MKIKEKFETREAAIAHLHRRGWQVSTILPASGSVVLSSELSNERRGVQQQADGDWAIVRDQATLKSW